MTETSFSCVNTLSKAIGDLGVHPDSISIHETCEPDGDKRVEIHLENGRITFMKRLDESFCIEMSESVRNSKIGKKFISKAKGGTGDLDLHYAKRAVLKAIANTYGHKLKSCTWSSGKIQIRVSVR